MSYCYSTDGESFTGRFNNYKDAIAEALRQTKDGDLFWIAENRPPIQPEDMWRAEDWLEHVSVQDDYAGDSAEGWDLSSEKQRQELEAIVRADMKEWLDKYGLRPTHYCVDEAVRYRNLGGGALRDVPLSEIVEYTTRHRKNACG